MVGIFSLFPIIMGDSVSLFKGTVHMGPLKWRASPGLHQGAFGDVRSPQSHARPCLALRTAPCKDPSQLPTSVWRECVHGTKFQTTFVTQALPVP